VRESVLGGRPDHNFKLGLLKKMPKGVQFQKNYNPQTGFTLVELLVVLFIILLLSTLLLVNYRGGQKKYALSQASQQLISDLRKAQNMAMSGAEIYGQYCGYGLEIDQSNRPTSYRFYADKSTDCQTSNNQYDSGDEILEIIKLPSRIRIQSTSPSPIDIFFKPPQPTTYINADAGAGVSGTITLEIEGTSFTKIVTVTTAGLIQSD
jgi:prepilin-type N-terminal cleavage/methylation domain-containing protein